MVNVNPQKHANDSIKKANARKLCGECHGKQSNIAEYGQLQLEIDE